MTMSTNAAAITMPSESKSDLKKDIEHVSNVEEDDPWTVKFDEDSDTRLRWADKNGAQRVFTVALAFGRAVAVLLLLYIFIIGLDLLGSAFQILGGTTAGLTFRQSDVFDNPIAGLCIGILATVLVQSSSTSTSICITLCGAGLLTVNQAVYMIMGANIGTSVTNTLVSMGQMSNRDEFRRAFAGATVHDMFNFLTVMIILPLEYFTKVLEVVSEATVNSLAISEGSEEMNFLKVITKPVTDRIISVDRSLITKIGMAQTPEELAALSGQSMVKWSNCDVPEKWFIYCAVDNWSDVAVGATLLILAMTMLLFALITMVKVLQSALKGSMATLLRKALNMEFSGALAWLSDWLLIVVGCIITILVQSSSITTSTLTPLVGMGVLRLEKMYPVTLGANVGTTVTGILAALANSNLHTALTLAFCHTYFNVAGILMWFVVPITRKVPISLARWMGNTTAKHRWFAIVYIITAFVLIPLGLLGLSLAGAAVFLGVLIPIVIVIAAVSIIALLRKHKPEILPGFLKDFSYLPAWMRTEPDWLKAYHAKLEAKAALQEAKRTTETPKLPWDERMMNRLGGDKTAESQVEMMA